MPCVRRQHRHDPAELGQPVGDQGRPPGCRSGRPPVHVVPVVPDDGPRGRAGRSRASTPASPSAKQWWIISSTATRPPASPSMSQISHRGRSRSSGDDISRAQSSNSCASSPGSGTAASRTWLEMSNSGSSTQTGADSPSSGSRTSFRSFGTRCSRPCTWARTASSRRRPRASCSGLPSKIPMEPMCIGVCGDSM